MRMITPSILSQPEQWKRWKGDIQEFCEESSSGMKVKKADTNVDEEWFIGGLGECWERPEQLWRLMRRFTDGEARRVVLSVREDNVYDAWSKQHHQSEPSIVVRKTQAMSQFTGMVNRRTNPHRDAFLDARV